MFDAMVDGWAQQQRTKFLRESTIGPRMRLVRRFAEFAGLYPWQWTPEEGEAWISHLRSGSTPLRLSTVRGYEVDIGLFCAYLIDARYDWVTECIAQFGRAPVQVFHEDNSIIHIGEYEGDPGRRPLTYDEVQALFDAADARVAQIRSRGRKGAIPALRDAVALKYCYAYGLRRQEVSRSDVVDLRRNSKFPAFGRFGALTVRHGKAARGGPPKRRTVLTVPEMSWIVDILDHYLTEVRSELDHTGHPALFLTERGSRLGVRALNTAFATARDAAGIDPTLDLHSLRHSYVTHLVEFDYPERFIQEQVGHAFSSTTAVYIGVSNEYRNGLLMQSIHARYGHLLNDGTPT
ncbi:site-specific integrase [Gordonia sp. Swx-4]|uniref:tyrosine-type recombinase/integrase n=1 Tax=Gordonia TaxID=2053 RepID=UPI0022A6BF60|nr:MULTISPECIES: site-specific integrase [Gordonia]MCZ0914064.1 site-specific integrase [Gordonia amicalis]WJG15724.1 site-specific integrase [Gordonia sp. Swx-4]